MIKVTSMARVLDLDSDTRIMRPVAGLIETNLQFAPQLE